MAARDIPKKEIYEIVRESVKKKHDLDISLNTFYKLFKNIENERYAKATRMAVLEAITDFAFTNGITLRVMRKQLDNEWQLSEINRWARDVYKIEE